MNIYKQIFENNKDLLERLDNKDFEAEFIKKDDVFLMRIGKPTSSYDSIDIDDFMTIHYDSETFKITGFTIPYVKEFVKNTALIMRITEEKERELDSQIIRTRSLS